MIGHVQKGMLIEDFLPAASEAKQPANKSGKPILITHSIGQLLQQIRNEWGKQEATLSSQATLQGLCPVRL
jgi:hypothetical protein